MQQRKSINNIQIFGHLPRYSGSRRTGFRATAGEGAFYLLPPLLRKPQSAAQAGNRRRSIFLKLKYLLPRYRGRQRTGFRRTTGERVYFFIFFFIPETKEAAECRSGGQQAKEHTFLSSSFSLATAEAAERGSERQLVREHTIVADVR